MTCNIAITGKGLAARLLALDLVRRGWSRGKIFCRKPDYLNSLRSSDARCLALSASSVAFFRQLGIWPYMAEQAGVIKKMQLCTPLQQGMANAKSKNGELLVFNKLKTHENLAFVVPLVSIEKAVMRVFKGCEDKLEFFDGSVENNDSGYHVNGCAKKENEKSFVSLVVCSGLHENLSPDIKVPLCLMKSHNKKDYAISCIVHLGNEHDNLAVQSFLPTGTLALLPLKGRRVSLIWSFNKAYLANDYAKKSSADFLAALSTNIAGIIDWKFTSAEPADIFPLKRHLRPCIGEKSLVLIGEATHALHPLAGQNFNLTIKDVAILSKHLLRSCRLGLSESPYVFLKDYARERHAELLSFFVLTELLQRSFSHDSDHWRAAARFSLAFVDGMPMAKNWLCSYACS